jgi:hypothetical protein
MRRSSLLAALLAALPAGCASGNESELIWESTLAFSPDPAAVVAPGEQAWILDLQFTPPLPLAKSSNDKSSYSVLVRLPSPIGTNEPLVAANVELAPETSARRAADIPVSEKTTYLRRGLRSRSLTRVTVRIKTKGGAAPSPALVSVGGSECLTGLGDEWQADQFGTEPTRMAYASDCVPR